MVKTFQFSNHFWYYKTDKHDPKVEVKTKCTILLKTKFGIDILNTISLDILKGINKILFSFRGSESWSSEKLFNKDDNLNFYR